MLRPVCQAILMNARGEHFGQGRAYRLLPWRLPGKVHIGIHRKAHARGKLLQRPQVRARNPDCYPELCPCLDAAFIFAVAVVIQYAVYPTTSYFPVRAVGHNGRILLRDANLVVETVGHPGTDLVRTQLPLVHLHMERVVDMVAATLGAQLSFKLLACPWLLCRQRSVCVVQSTISMPS